MSEKSIVQEARDIQLAMELITLGARLQMLESETQLSRGRLIKLYKELRGSPPPKGMLPQKATPSCYILSGYNHPLKYLPYRLSATGASPLPQDPKAFWKIYAAPCRRDYRQKG